MTRLDRHLAESGQARSRTHAAELIREGRVLVNGSVCAKPSRGVGPEDEVSVAAGEGPEYVSRAGRKLAGALEAFPQVRVSGRRCLDAGASTGGFTQVLLEVGAAHVAAVDVGHDQLDPRIRRDPRVLAVEGLNIRQLAPERIGGPVQLVVGDLSFISLTLVLGPLTRATEPGGDLLLLVKPQFEVGRSRLNRHGVVTDEAARRRAIEDVIQAAEGHGLVLCGRADSVLSGQDGNREHFLHLRRPEEP